MEVVILKEKNIYPENAIVNRRRESNAVNDICGKIFPIISETDSSILSVAEAEIGSATIPHFHTKITEVYYVKEGEGKVVLGVHSFNVTEGSVVLIPANLIHFLIPETVMMKVIVFTANGPWRENDQFVFNGEREGFSTSTERIELIESITRISVEGGSNKTLEDSELNSCSIEELRRKLKEEVEKNRNFIEETSKAFQSTFEC